MKGIVDRFEGNLGVIELDDGVTKDYSRSEVDHLVKVGDSVTLIDGIWIKDEEETRRRAKKFKSSWMSYGSRRSKFEETLI